MWPELHKGEPDLVLSSTSGTLWEKPQPKLFREQGIPRISPNPR
jgi:hypothetical protein